MTNDAISTHKDKHEIKSIQVEQGSIPQAPSIIEDANGKRWVILTAYKHLDENYIQGVPIDSAQTYKIIEKKTI